MSTVKTNNVQVGQSGTATNNFTLYQPTSPDGTVRLGVGNSGATTADVLVANSSGNFGLGVTPSAWGTGYKAFQIGDSALSNYGTGYAFLSQNALFGTSTNTYINSAAASYYRQFLGTHAWFTAPSGTAGNPISFSQAMTLNASGNLGVGTSSPTDTNGFGRALDLNGTDGAAYYARTGGSGTNFTLFGNYGADGYILNRGAGNLYFSNNNAERARITSGGDFLVGTTSATAIGTGYRSINVSGTNGSGVVFKNNAETSFGYAYNDSTNNRFYIQQNTGGVYLAGGGTSWTSASDERVKDIIEPISDAAAKVSTLRAVIGKYKTDPQEKRRSFLIAQDVQAVLPEAVDATNPDELGLQYADMIPLLVAAIKEQQAIITDLRQRVAALESK